MSKTNSFSELDKLRGMAISAGAVFIGPWGNIDHEKFIVVAGVDENSVLVCTVLINSRINQYIIKRPKLHACQVEIKANDYEFLSHDSYINCAQPLKAKFEHFKSDEYKYCGLLSDNDLMQVKKNIINSGVLTEEEINMFFEANS